MKDKPKRFLFLEEGKPGVPGKGRRKRG